MLPHLSGCLMLLALCSALVVFVSLNGAVGCYLPSVVAAETPVALASHTPFVLYCDLQNLSVPRWLELGWV